MNAKDLNKIKLNPHIKVINPNLWTVNFNYISNGWVKEIEFNDYDGKSSVALAKDVIILDSSKEMCSRIIPIIQFIMKLPDKKIGTKESFCKWLRKDIKSFKNSKDDVIINWIKMKGYNQVAKLYLQLCELEIQRRKYK